MSCYSLVLERDFVLRERKHKGDEQTVTQIGARGCSCKQSNSKIGVQLTSFSSLPLSIDGHSRQTIKSRSTVLWAADKVKIQLRVKKGYGKCCPY